MIALQDISKVYTLSQAQRIAAVREVNLEVVPGEFLILTGRSGSGKTTLLNLIAGLARPTAGRVLWDGVDLWSMTDRQRSRLRGRRIGFIFQFPSLLPTLTVVDNITLPTAFRANGSQPGHRERARELLASVGLASKIDVYPRQLSAGEQQRVVIARALFNRPELLLADEPTSDLDEKTEHEIMELVARIHGETGITVVLVTHTVQLVSYGTRALRMAAGCIEAAGDSGRAGSD